MAYLEDDEAEDGADIAAPTSGALTGDGKAALRGALAGQQEMGRKLGMSYEDLTRRQEAKVAQQRQVIDSTIEKIMSARAPQGVIPLLSAAAGFLSPTRTGGTGESIGNALRGLTPALEAEDRERRAHALQIGQLQGQGEGLEAELLDRQRGDVLKQILGGQRVSATLANALARAERTAQYAPTMLAKAIVEMNALPDGDPRRATYQRYIEQLSTRGEMTPAQRTRLDAQTERHIDGLVRSEMAALEKEGRFATPEDRADTEEGVRARIMARYNRGALKPPAPVIPVGANEQGAPSLASEAAPMPNVTTTAEAPTGPAPVASPTPSAQKPGPGYSLRLPSGEEKAQRDLLQTTGIGLGLIDEVTARLSEEAANSRTSSTTGVGGRIQRFYNDTVGQLTGKNWDARDTETMSKMAALKPVLQKAIKVDSNMSKDERRDLESVLNTWDKMVSRETVLTNLKTIRSILARQNEAARTRLGPRANEPVQQNVSRETNSQRLRFDAEGNPVSP